jgi:hypothetical protein
MPILICKVEVEHCAEECRDDVLFELRKFHAQTRMTASTPAEEGKLVFLIFCTIWKVASGIPFVRLRERLRVEMVLAEVIATSLLAR